MTATGLGLISGAALFMTGLAGPAPRDATTHKPSPEQCAAAARDGRTLPGCADDDEVGPAPAPAEVDEAQPRERFMVCPGNPRCPR